MKKDLQRFASWFFEKGNPRGAAALRIGYGLIYLFMLWDLHPVMNLLMGHSGLYGTLEKNYINLSRLFTLLYRYDLPWQLEIWFWVSVAVTLAMTLGFLTRISFALTFISLLLFQTRAPYVLYGADQVLVMSAFWLFFLDCGRCWSLDELIRKSRGKRSSEEIELWPVKSIQIQIALIYLCTGLAKLATDSWRDGSAVYYAVQAYTIGWTGVLALTSHKSLFVAMTYYSLLAELSFAFLVFRRTTRIFALLAVFFMHVGIDILMQIRFFSLTMYVGYLAFIRPSEWQWISEKCSTPFTSLIRRKSIYPMKRES